MRGAEAFEITNKQTYNFNSMPGPPRNFQEVKTKLKELFAFTMTWVFVQNTIQEVRMCVFSVPNSEAIHLLRINTNELWES